MPGRVEFAALLARAFGEPGNQIHVGVAQDVGPHVGFPQTVLLEMAEQAQVCVFDGRNSQSRSPSSDQGALVWFWLLVICAMLLLGTNKQLDLQSWFSEVGRDLATAQGWYEERRSVQALFISALVLGGLTGMAVMTLWLRRVIRHIAGAVLGLSFLVIFVAGAASFHHVDRWLGYGVVRLNWVLELGGITLIAVSAWRQTPDRSSPAQAVNFGEGRHNAGKRV